MIEKLNLTAVYPISASVDENAIDNLPCSYFGEVEQGSDSQLIQQADVLSLVDAEIDFITSTSYKYLALQIKNVGNFFLISLKVTDSTGKHRTIMVSNNRSTVLIMKDDIKIPLLAKEGWQYICLDLEDILRRAYGVGFRSCSEVVFSGTCRIWRAYFQEKKYADCQLPYHLRVGI